MQDINDLSLASELTDTILLAERLSEIDINLKAEQALTSDDEPHAAVAPAAHEKRGMMMSHMRQLLQLCAKIPVDCELLHDSKDKESAPGVKLVLEPVSRAIAERAAEGGLYANAVPYLKMAAALAKSM